MSIYQRWVLPHLIHFACQAKEVMEQRAAIIPQAEGAVLEIGVGSGLNFPYYDPARVRKVVGLDPSRELLKKAKKSARDLSFDVEFTASSAEEMSFSSESFDCVVSTYTFCTIPDAPAALREIARVLRRDGTFLFLEHGAASEERVRRWQSRLTPVWKRVAGGCHLDRDIAALIRDAGFCIQNLETYYLESGWKATTFHYLGTATCPKRADCVDPRS